MENIRLKSGMTLYSLENRRNMDLTRGCMVFGDGPRIYDFRKNYIVDNRLSTIFFKPYFKPSATDIVLDFKGYLE